MNLEFDENAKSGPVPIGLYGVQVDEIEFTKSKEKQKDMVKVTFAVVEGPENSKDTLLFRERKIFENYMCDQKWRMNHLYLMAKAAGLDMQYFKDFELPANHTRLLRKTLKIRVTQEARKDGKGISNRIDGENYFPWTGQPLPPKVEAAPAAPAAPVTQGKLPFEQ